MFRHQRWNSCSLQIKQHILNIQCCLHLCGDCPALVICSMINGVSDYVCVLYAAALLDGQLELIPKLRCQT